MCRLQGLGVWVTLNPPKLPFVVQSARAFVNSGVPGAYDTSSQGFTAAARLGLWGLVR